MGDSQAVLDRLTPVEREIVSGTGRVYLRRTLPYRTRDNRIAGVVITFVDISERKRAEEALRTVEDRFGLVSEGAPDFAMLLADPSSRIVTRWPSFSANEARRSPPWGPPTIRCRLLRNLSPTSLSATSACRRKTTISCCSESVR
jgi:PAS domain-containing protein